ncbi:carbohydrate ABC transporter permease [Gandjariella thermophila]|uniref:Sugar ABC transporter permease n=1 Tax=Gandjariella thermophila TaxID=1931992 RepID=A0A4D4J9T7_9PSEU|nr:sugar ABC transporter permease [Gandjariella thermophila]GDY31760.1 sugar ABC transporter permease [Gandjariella thermophila]
MTAGSGGRTGHGELAPTTRRRRRRLTSRAVAPYLFILPNMVVFGLFTIWPALNSFNISLYDSGNGRRFNWVGTDNYREILSDPEFWGVARHTAVFVVGFVVLVTVAATALALLLNAQVRGRGLFRAAYFLPVLISPVVVGLIWNWALERQNGLVNTVLGAMGLGAPGWLLNPNLAMGVTIFVGLWTHLGFYAMILLAGLQGIDPSLYDAARIDGAGAWQRVRTITLPLLRPTTLVVVVLATIAGFQAFDFIYTLTGGGPVGATTLIVQYIYLKAFESPIRYGLASAAGVILFLTVFGVTLLNYAIGRRREAI